ncbi:hypothetical protein MMC25_003810 [Agyrium rufum]|nr:hypothetical protein [Agyrium rufum]
MAPLDTKPDDRQPLLSEQEAEYGANHQNGNGTTPKSPDGDVNDVEEAAPHDSEPTISEQEAAEVRKNIKYMLPALAIGIFLAALDASIINTNYAKIATDFNNLELASWISTAYFLAMSSAQPLYGKLSDIFGRKACVLFSYSVFTIGNLCCGLAGSMEMFIAARVVQGCGGAGVGTLVTILISDVIPLRDRGPWQGYLNLINASGMALGAPIGGLLADTIGWRWTFYIQVPLMLLAVISVVFLLKLPHKDNSDWRAKLRRVDFPGALLLVGLVTCLLLGFDHGSNISWSSKTTIIPLAICPPLFIAFLLVEAKFASEPFTPGHVMLDRTVLSVYINNFFTYAAWLALMFYVPLFYQAVDEVSASQAGLRLLPGILTAVTGVVLGGFVLKATGRYYWLMVLSQAVVTISMVAVVLGATYPAYDVLGISLGLGVNGLLYGFVVVGSLIALISNVSPEDQAVATACMFLFRSLGGAIGISFSGTIVQHFLRKNLVDALPDRKDAADIAKGVRQSLDYVKNLSPEIQSTVRAEYGSAIRGAFVFQTLLFFAATVATFFIREKRLEK